MPVVTAFDVLVFPCVMELENEYGICTPSTSCDYRFVNQSNQLFETHNYNRINLFNS
jgi:hypothetical protein